MSFRTASFAVALAAASFVSVAARAGDLEQNSVRVNYSDLNLQNASGRTALLTRLHAAADQACGPVDGRDLKGVRSFNACRQSAMAQAMPAAHAAFAAAQSNTLMASDSTQEPAGRNSGN